MHALRISNCLKESVWLYRLTCPVTPALLARLGEVCPVRFPMGDPFPFFKAETPALVVTGNLGRTEIRLTEKDPSNCARARVERILADHDGACR